MVSLHKRKNVHQIWITSPWISWTTTHIYGDPEHNWNLWCLLMFLPYIWNNFLKYGWIIVPDEEDHDHHADGALVLFLLCSWLVLTTKYSSKRILQLFCSNDFPVWSWSWAVLDRRHREEQEAWMRVLSY